MNPGACSRTLRPADRYALRNAAAPSPEKQAKTLRTPPVRIASNAAVKLPPFGTRTVPASSGWWRIPLNAAVNALTCSCEVDESSATMSALSVLPPRYPPSAVPGSVLTYEVRQMYLTVPSVPGDAAEPSSGTCADST